MKKQNLHLLILLFSLLPLFMISCGGGGGGGGGIFSKKASYPANVDSQAQEAFQAAERNYAAGQYETALSGYRQFLSQYPYTALSDESSYKIGKIYFLQQKLNESVRIFEDLAAKTPDRVYRAKGLLLSGYARYKTDDYSSAHQTLAGVNADDLPPKMQLQLYSFRILAGEKAGLNDDQINSSLRKLADVYSRDSSLDGLKLEDVLSSQEVELRLQRLAGASKSASGSVKVGVLIPLSGPSANYGETALKAIKCAAGQEEACKVALGSEAGGLPDVELVVQDSGGSPDQIDRLIEGMARQNVDAIIGPMSASLAFVAAKKAQALRIPVLPITQKADLMKLGDFVFQMGYSTRSQMADLAKQAREKGYKSIGVFAPRNNYGNEMASLFKTAFTEAGGQVVSEASYDAGDLSPQARALKTGAPKSSSEGKTLFDAIFVPDSYASMSRVASALEFAGLQDIPLLGTNAWNDSQLTTETLKSFPGSFFLDLFKSADNKPLAVAFENGFKNAYGKKPTSLEALGFDALWFVRQAARNSVDSRKIRDALLGGSFRGVTGITSFSTGIGPVIAPFVLKPHPVMGEVGSGGE